MAFNKPKGTVDFFPEEKETQNMIFGKLREVVNRYNYREIEAPAFEQIDLLTAKSGEEVKTQIFNLDKKGKEEFGLRFDITISATRMFIEKQKSIAKPVKWFYATRMWRYERPQAGRLREFYQFGVECFGSSNSESDAEQINIVIDSLTSLGLTKDDFVIKLNNRNLLQGILQAFIKEEKIPDLIRLIDKKFKIPEEAFDEEAGNLGVKDVTNLKQVLAIDSIVNLEKLELNDLAKDGLGDLKDVYSLLDKDFIKIDLFTARGLDYYTGTVFECFDKQGKLRSIAGGGRYDKMIESFGGQSCPAVGFGIGYSTLSLLLASKGLMPQPGLGPDYFVAITDDTVRKDALNIIKDLRKKYSVECDLASRNLSNQIKYASSIDAKNLLVIGPDEIKTKQVKIKNLETGIEDKKDIGSL